MSKKHEEEFKRIHSYIIDNQRFLDPQLSLETLSQEFNISTGHLSKIVNVYGKNGFNDFINEMRVQKSKELLGDEEYSQYTIVAVGLECGFNSKSTFYTAFKKFTDLTPSQFKRKYV